MQVTIDDGLRRKCPRAALGCVTASVEAPSAPAELVALMQRVVGGKGLPQINAVVDAINLVSVESRLSIGLYDLVNVEGDIVFRAGRSGETYKGIGKYDLNLEGLPVFADSHGPHGSATSDSERTMVTEKTKEVLAIIV